MSICSHGGDLGDSVVTLQILSQLHDGPHSLHLTQSRVTRMKTPADVIRWHQLLAPLALAQPYISECRPKPPGSGKVFWASEGFRHSGLHPKHCSLFAAQLSHLIHVKDPIDHLAYTGITSSLKWLTVPILLSADPNRIVIARSDRYQNDVFPWKRIVDHYGSKLMFVGLHEEHVKFQHAFGKVEHRPVENLYDLAQLISGSALFIGNQSMPMTIAEGLKHPTIQETSLVTPDCIYYRPNAQWVDNGKCVLPAVGDSPALEIQSNRTEWPQKHLMQEYIQNKFGAVETARLLAGYPRRTVKEML